MCAVSTTGVDSGNSEVGSPLLQMMVLYDARPGAGSLSIETVKFYTEDHPSVLSRIISTIDESVPVTSILPIAHAFTHPLTYIIGVSLFVSVLIGDLVTLRALCQY